MRQDDYWEKFMGSGRIEDYLEFRAECAARQDHMQQEEEQSGVREAPDRKNGGSTVKEHAGFSDSYGNDLKINSGRGI